MFRLIDRRGYTYYKPEDQSCNDIYQMMMEIKISDWVEVYEDQLCRDTVFVKGNEIYLVSREKD